MVEQNGQANTNNKLSNIQHDKLNKSALFFFELITFFFFWMTYRVSPGVLIAVGHFLDSFLLELHEMGIGLYSTPVVQIRQEFPVEPVQTECHRV